MQKILVVAPSWVGDCMLMQPMLSRLKHRFSACSIDVFAPAWTTSLLAQLPEVHEVIVNPFPHGALQIGARYRAGLSLRDKGYDAAYVLPNSLKSALVPFFARIPKRIGFIGEFRYGLLNETRKLDKAKLPLMVERFAYLAEDKGAPLSRPVPDPHLSVSDALRHSVLQRLQLTLDRPVVVFCPGAEYGPAKRWPAASFAQLAQRLHTQGMAVWLIGSAKDKAVGDEIVALSQDQCRNLCGETDLRDAIALLASAAWVVSNDSGLMHLAAALDRPLLALFGSSSPRFTPPLSKQAQVIQLGLPCSPCFKRECPLGHFDCMMKMTPDTIAQPILTSLQRQT